MRATEMLLFLKFYEPHTRTLSFVDTHIATTGSTLEDLLPVLRAFKGLAAGQQLAVYEEVEFENSLRIDKLQPGETLQSAELQSGDILVFQTLPPQPAPPPHDPATLLTIPQFFNHVNNVQRLDEASGHA